MDLSNRKLSKLPDDLPLIVEGGFDCSVNNLTNLNGSPIEVIGKFNCSFNNLTNLEGCPEKTGDMAADNNKLISLIGCKKVNSLSIRNNYLTTIDFCPEIEKSLDCSCNNITSLSGLPSDINFTLLCSNNQLTALKGGANRAYKNFNISSNNLTDLNGAPEFIGESFVVNLNNLKSLHGMPFHIGINFYCRHNDDLIDISDIWDSYIGNMVFISYNKNLAMLPLVKLKHHIDPFSNVLNEILKRNHGESKQNILDLQYDLIENGFEDNARW